MCVYSVCLCVCCVFHEAEKGGGREEGNCLLFSSFFPNDDSSFLDLLRRVSCTFDRLYDHVIQSANENTVGKAKALGEARDKQKTPSICRGFLLLSWLCNRKERQLNLHTYPSTHTRARSLEEPTYRQRPVSA